MPSETLATQSSSPRPDPRAQGPRSPRPSPPRVGLPAREEGEPTYPKPAPASRGSAGAPGRRLSQASASRRPRLLPGGVRRAGLSRGVPRPSGGSTAAGEGALRRRDWGRGRRERRHRATGRGSPGEAASRGRGGGGGPAATEGPGSGAPAPEPRRALPAPRSEPSAHNGVLSDVAGGRGDGAGGGGLAPGSRAAPQPAGGAAAPGGRAGPRGPRRAPAKSPLISLIDQICDPLQSPEKEALGVQKALVKGIESSSCPSSSLKRGDFESKQLPKPPVSAPNHVPGTLTSGGSPRPLSAVAETPGGPHEPGPQLAVPLLPSSPCYDLSLEAQA